MAERGRRGGEHAVICCQVQSKRNEVKLCSEPGQFSLILHYIHLSSQREFIKYPLGATHQIWFWEFRENVPRTLFPQNSWSSRGRQVRKQTGIKLFDLCSDRGVYQGQVEQRSNAKTTLGS